MTIRRRFAASLAVVLAISLGSAVAAEALAPESKRLIRARDYIADEQWALAIEQLHAAVADPKEPRRDEALYWLAHSQHHSGDPGSAIGTISRLEREYPKSMWVRNGQSLRIEIAVRLQRRDVLWWTATPPPARPPVVERTFGRRGPRAPAAAPVAIDPPTPGAAVDPEAPTPAPAPKPGSRTKEAPPLPPPPPAIWWADGFGPDPELQILALAGLMRIDDVEKVVPILGRIALEGDSGPAIRAVFMLAQSPSPKAREAVVRVARTGKESVQVAAVRDLGRFGGPEIARELLSVYSTASVPVKWQIVNTFGERAEQSPLSQIANLEKDGKLRFSAISKLGQAGGVAQLTAMYKSASIDSRRSIIGGLFFARAEQELIRIAESERNAGNDELCGHAIERLRLLGSPKAKEYLLEVGKKR